MLTIDRETGTIRYKGYDLDINPDLTLTRFLDSPLAKASKIKNHRPKYGEVIGFLPAYHCGEIEVLCKLQFQQNRFSDAVIFLTYPGDDADAIRDMLFQDEEQQKRLAEQEAWLRDHAGAPSGEYDWGLIWNRYNINAEYFDIAVFYK